MRRGSDEGARGGTRPRTRATTKAIAGAFARVVLVASLVGACQRTPPEGPAVATVGGRPIGAALLDAYSREKAGRPAAELSAPDRRALLEQLVDLELLRQDAEHRHLPSDPAIAARLELARLTALRDVALEETLRAPPTAAELQAAYVAEVGAGDREYRVQHVLVATEALANEAVVRLGRGESFGAVARSMSADPSKQHDGELGWISPRAFPPAFVDAARDLAPGAYTKAPVHTQYGWHVIRLLETRVKDAPAMDAVRPQLDAAVRRARERDRLRSLRERTPIDYGEARKGG